jgi:aryl-alcohol dehydrogenase-like predicted oxidoreductase
MSDAFVSRFSDFYAADFYRDAAGRPVSSIGMGTYLGDCDDREDARYTETIRNGIARGLNVIDTAINYRCQRSERAVGKAVRQAVDTGLALREDVMVCTKGGYVPLDGEPPASRDEYDAYLASEYFAQGTMQPGDVVAGGHCLKPRFLENQVSRSLENLGAQRIDLYYLHNPEQQLDALPREDFRTLMLDAFTQMESEVAAGRIGFYGCATWNGFRVPATHRSHLSLSELAAIATEAGGKDHHFRAIQLPVNLAMTEAIRTPTQQLNGKALPLLDAARELGVAVFASASLMQSQLSRNLPEGVRGLFPSLQTDAQRAIAFVRALPLASALVGMKSIEHLEENLRAGSTAIQS